MNKKILIIACLFIAFGILFGAFGAHGLKEIVDSKLLASFETGVRYQLFMGLGLLIQQTIGKLIGIDVTGAATTIAVGTLLFSGSIYMLIGFDYFGWWKLPLVPLTPIGGVLMIAGWFMTAYKLSKTNF